MAKHAYHHRLFGTPVFACAYIVGHHRGNRELMANVGKLRAVVWLTAPSAADAAYPMEFANAVKT